MDLRKEFIMASQTRPNTAKAGRRRNSMQYGAPPITDRQLDAYLAAKEVVRRIQRTSSLVFPACAARSGSLRAGSG